ncbi:lipopolysaccharide biosynthesis protein [uncultured Alistipes sp.]|uniref:lipopolysaccharide biosynthesis protein n=1 Tax=uncultured Alistipes sp. TaxID=538949 RepID=UPI0026181826|nr:lipopolysaccharide biosynthesis protein [uncultured Alistipes sp.]
MEQGLRDRVARGVAWSLAERIGTALVQMAVRIVLLNLLLPEDLGVVAILLAFATVALVVVDSGFSQTLIRGADPAASDFKSVFVFNLAVSLLLYGLLVASSPWVARCYDMPLVASLAPLFYLVLPANALCVIQTTLFVRRFRFALLSKVTFAASVASGAVAVAMALAGCGIWSVAAQQVLMLLFRAALLWTLGDWRPSAPFDLGALRRMAPFSLRLMATDLIAALYNKIPQLFLGSMYAPRTLGYYDQAQKLKELPLTSTMSAVQSVVFPALSRVRDDAPKLAESYRQVAMMTAFALFPVMLGLSAVAPDLFAALLAPKWRPTVPYLEAACLVGLFYPVAMVAYNLLKVRSDGAIIVRLEVVKKLLLTAVFALTIPRSVMAVIWGLVLFAFLEMAINLCAAQRFTTLPFGRLVRTLLPVALLSGAMYVAVRFTAAVMPGGPLLRLLCELAVGAAVYFALAAAFRLEAFRIARSMLRAQLQKGTR